MRIHEGYAYNVEFALDRPKDDDMLVYLSLRTWRLVQSGPLSSNISVLSKGPGYSSTTVAQLVRLRSTDSVIASRDDFDLDQI